MINKPDNIHIPDPFAFQHIQYRRPGFFCKIILVLENIPVVQHQAVGAVLNVDQYFMQCGFGDKCGDFDRDDPFVDTGELGVVLVTACQLGIAEIELSIVEC